MGTYDGGGGRCLLRFSIRVAVGLVLVTALVGGCNKADGNGSGSGDGSSAAAGEVKTFPIRGKVVSVDAAKGSVLLDHEAVPGFMDAMTMPYKLKDPDRKST